MLQCTQFMKHALGLLDKTLLALGFGHQHVRFAKYHRRSSNDCISGIFGHRRQRLLETPLALSSKMPISMNSQISRCPRSPTPAKCCSHFRTCPREIGSAPCFFQIFKHRTGENLLFEPSQHLHPTGGLTAFHAWWLFAVYCHARDCAVRTLRSNK